MDSTESEGETNLSRTRKFGLPDWMLTNFERLNTATDFEQYACSPPESEGYLTEYGGNLDCPDQMVSSEIPGSENAQLQQQPVIQMHLPEVQSPIQKYSSTSSSPAGKDSSPLSPRYHYILDALKCEDAIYSSPDTTPCVTPESSPAPRRKISGEPQDTVQSNPKKWFYLGFPKNQDKFKSVKGQCSLVKEFTIDTIQKDEKMNNILDGRSKDIKSKNTNDCNNSKLAFPIVKNKKCTISNFDINAISPTSW